MGGPATPTPPAVRKRSRRRVVLAVGAVVVVLAGAGVAVAFWEHNKGPGTAASIAAWQDGGGRLLSLHLSLDADTAMSPAQLGNVDPRKACTDLQTEVDAAQAYLKIPDQVAQTAWAQALSYLSSGAKDCLTAIANHDAALSAKSGEEIFHGDALAIGVSRRLDQLSGTP